MINYPTTDIVHLHYMRPRVCYHGEHTQHLAVLAGLIVSKQTGIDAAWWNSDGIAGAHLDAIPGPDLNDRVTHCR
jgi:hypothetical protein